MVADCIHLNVNDKYDLCVVKRGAYKYIYYIYILEPDRNSGPVPVQVEFGPVPVDLAGTAIFFMLEKIYFKVIKIRNVIFYEI